MNLEGLSIGYYGSVSSCQNSGCWKGTSANRQSSDCASVLPEDSANALVTDPPYYDSVPYAYLSDFFYVWLARGCCIKSTLTSCARMKFLEGRRKSWLTVHTNSAIRPRTLRSTSVNLGKRSPRLGESLRPDGIGSDRFRSKTTSSWEAILNAVVDAGWIDYGIVANRH